MSLIFSYKNSSASIKFSQIRRSSVLAGSLSQRLVSPSQMTGMIFSRTVTPTEVARRFADAISSLTAEASFPSTARMF